MGKAANIAFSMLSPFWIMTITVWPGVMAGLIRSCSVGGISGQFLVTVRI